MPPTSEFARLFTAEKTIEDRALNLAGVQPLRAVLARLLYRLRPGSRDPYGRTYARWCHSHRGLPGPCGVHSGGTRSGRAHEPY